MVEFTNLILTALWHDADLISMQFTWAPDDEVTGICTTILNPEEDMRPLHEFGITTRSVTITFRNVDDVQSILSSNYATRPTIDDWRASRSVATGLQQHTIRTIMWMSISVPLPERLATSNTRSMKLSSALPPNTALQLTASRARSLLFERDPVQRARGN